MEEAAKRADSVTHHGENLKFEMRDLRSKIRDERCDI